MKKLLIALLISLLIVTGCDIKDVSTDGVGDIFNSILYIDNNLSNLYMDGYHLYLPQGVKLIDKSDYNLLIQDKNRKYYLYIDTIAYYYKTQNKYEENNVSFYSKKLNYNDKIGYIDISEKNEYYFVVLMYNYAKIETYVLKKDLNEALIKMSSILSTIKYNDIVIARYVGSDGQRAFQEEKFNIFAAKKENDNFLEYESEYGTYKEKIIINNDDVIDVDEIED